MPFSIRGKNVMLRLAFAGTGYIAKIHALAALSLPNVELAAVVNHRAESMREFGETYGISRRYRAIEDLIRDGEVDAISINTPNHLHAPQTIAALEAGIHVMVEKPMALNAGEAEQMLAASEKAREKYGTLLMVAHCWRFDAEVLWIKQQIDCGQLGEIVRTKGYGAHTNWGPAGWFTQPNLAGGGALVDMGIHAVDTARFLLGDPQPESVYAQLGTHYGDYEVDDTGMMIVNWSNGVRSYIESGWWQPHADGEEAATQIYGTQGYGRLFPTHLKLPNRADETVATVESGFPSPRDPHCPQSMYDAQLAYFVDCIEQKRTPSPGGAEGLVNMKILDAAYASSRSGEVVKL
jgi:predicted dehydrogenase